MWVWKGVWPQKGLKWHGLAMMGYCMWASLGSNSEKFDDFFKKPCLEWDFQMKAKQERTLTDTYKYLYVYQV